MALQEETECRFNTEPSMGLVAGFEAPDPPLSTPPSVATHLALTSPASNTPPPPVAVAPPSPPPPSPPAAVAVAAPSKAALAPGFRFHPTDEELVSYYLKRKISNKPVRFSAIADVDIYKQEPWELGDKASLKNRDQEWYFYSMLDKKYGNGARMNRATGKGYWKATGKDRAIRRDSKLIAMKKTLVFHSGRAPGGQRTDWVMHEYRLSDEELKRLEDGARPGDRFDTYVLCRVFFKNKIGPPCGNRYAPFLEEEWADDESTLVPGEDPADEVVHGHNAGCETNGLVQDNYSHENDPVNNGDVGQASKSLVICKSERVDDFSGVDGNNREASGNAVRQYKRRKYNQDAGSSSSQSLPTPAREGQTSEVSDMTMMTPSATAAVSALLEFSLMEPIEPKETPRVPPPTVEAASLDLSLPPSTLKFVNDLQGQIHSLSVENETLKLEMMSAQAMINILQSRIEFLRKENDDLKRSISNGD